MEHFGLYFTPAAVERVTQNRRKPPYKDALAALDAPPPDDPLAAAVTHGFRRRFLGDAPAAARAAALLTEQDAGLVLPDEMAYRDACAVTMAAGHAFEMVRDTLPDDVRAAWLGRYAAQVGTLRATDAPRLLDDIWRAALEIVGGVVLERADLLDAGAAGFRAVIDGDIHPEGYLPRLVEKSKGGALVRQVHAAQGLALAAEAASHAGVDLWGYEARGISAKTAAIYAAAYYEYRETWHWDAPPDDAENEQFYRHHAGFFEMLNSHLRPVVLRDTLAKLRPLADPYGGGFTTLSHGQPKRGLFGR